MKRALPLILILLIVGGCHRSNTQALPADAASEAQARTSAKAVADIAAAEQAARAPLPYPVHEPAAEGPAPERRRAAPAEESVLQDDLPENGTDR